MTEEVTEESAESAEETPEDAYAELEAKVKLLQDGNLSPAEIVKKVFEDNYDTSTSDLAKIMGMTAFDVGRIKAHARHPSKKSASERLEKKELETGKPGSVYKTDTDMNSILKEILGTHPDVTERQILEIMSWAKMTPSGLQPAHLYALLSSMKGLDKNAASMLAQKYSLAISKASQEGAVSPQFGFGPIPIAPQQSNQPQQFYWPQQPWAQPSPVQGPPPGYMSKDEVDERIDAALAKEREEKKIEKLEDKVVKLTEDIPKMIRENMPGQPETAMETVEIPIDANGNACLPGAAVSYRKITRPLGSESDLDKFLKYRQLFGKELSADDIRRVVKEEVGTKGPVAEDPKLKELKDEISATRKELQETKDKISAEDKKRLEDKIGNLENQMGNLNARLASSGVNSAEGVMASAITTFGSRKPGEKALDVVREILVPGVAPVPQEAVPSGAGILAEEAGKRGLVTIVRDRIRR